MPRHSTRGHVATAGPTRRKESLADEGAATRIAAVLTRARESGLTSGKTGRIAGRVAPELVERAKARTGLSSDTALIEFALANLAVDDRFPEAFKALRATVDPDLDLEI